MQNLADLLGATVVRPSITETTALGVAYLAGLQQGTYKSLSEIADLWRRDAIFESKLGKSQREQRYLGWKDAVGRVTNKN